MFPPEPFPFFLRGLYIEAAGRGVSGGRRKSDDAGGGEVHVPSAVPCPGMPGMPSAQKVGG